MKASLISLHVNLESNISKSNTKALNNKFTFRFECLMIASAINGEIYSSKKRIEDTMYLNGNLSLTTVTVTCNLSMAISLLTELGTVIPTGCIIICTMHYPVRHAF